MQVVARLRILRSWVNDLVAPLPSLSYLLSHILKASAIYKSFPSEFIIHTSLRSIQLTHPASSSASAIRDPSSPPKNPAQAFNFPLPVRGAQTQLYRFGHHSPRSHDYVERKCTVGTEEGSPHECDDTTSEQSGCSSLKLSPQLPYTISLKIIRMNPFAQSLLAIENPMPKSTYWTRVLFSTHSYYANFHDRFFPNTHPLRK